MTHSDRVFARAIQREENAGYRRAEAIRLEEMRLDGLQEGLWDKAVGGDARSVEVCLKVLERRARMTGLDFADMISGQLVEVEQAKVKIMATALVGALKAIDATPKQREVATAKFLDDLRTLQARTPAALEAPPVLHPDDEALL
jgi:hypothetical protein